MHQNGRGAVGFDAAAIRKALDGSDAVLLLGGPFFEEVWFAPGSAFPPDAAVLQIEDSPERLSRNFPLRAGLLARPGPARRALSAATRGGAAGAAFLNAATARNTAFGSLKAQEMAAARERAAKR